MSRVPTRTQISSYGHVEHMITIGELFVHARPTSGHVNGPLSLYYRRFLAGYIMNGELFVHGVYTSRHVFCYRPRLVAAQRAKMNSSYFLGGGGGGDSHMKRSGKLVGNFCFDPYEVLKRVWFKPLKGTKNCSIPNWKRAFRNKGFTKIYFTATGAPKRYRGNTKMLLSDV